MNAFIRWGKFNLVGAMGMGVQLAALALFNRWTAGHYLYASAAAIRVRITSSRAATASRSARQAIRRWSST